MKIKTGISVDKEVLEELDRQAKEWNMSRSAYITFMVIGKMKLVKGEK